MSKSDKKKETVKFVFKGTEKQIASEIVMAIVEDDKVEFSHYEIDTDYHGLGTTMIMAVYKQRAVAEDKKK